MYKWILFIIAGFISGVLGGMGMGGGTVLIPLLTLFFNIEQHVAQAVNLLSFIPMAFFALIFHIKNKFVQFKGVLFIIILGILSSVFFSLLVKDMHGDTLKRLFGAFLIILSICQVFSSKNAD